MKNVLQNIGNSSTHKAKYRAAFIALIKTKGLEYFQWYSCYFRSTEVPVIILPSQYTSMVYLPGAKADPFSQ